MYMFTWITHESGGFRQWQCLKMVILLKDIAVQIGLFVIMIIQWIEWLEKYVLLPSLCKLMIIPNKALISRLKPCPKKEPHVFVNYLPFSTWLTHHPGGTR